MTGLRAITVCVGYEDLLTVTLPWNKHHFDEIQVVTDYRSYNRVRELANKFGAQTYRTDTFYHNGAVFNKWAALEEALTECDYRWGWICIMDADVLWPKDVFIDGSSNRYTLFYGMNGQREPYQSIAIGQLMSPLRRMAPWPTMPLIESMQAAFERTKEGYVIPSEQSWHLFPVHRNVNEWAGYSQVFHADDPHLGTPPWHEIDWIHAGGADSLFQRKWPKEAKVRPNWEVLHLGNAGENWFGRNNPDKEQLMAEVWRRRRAIRNEGGSEADSFAPEKLGRDGAGNPL